MAAYPYPYPQPQPQPQPQSSGSAVANPIPIIGAQYCAPYPVDLNIVRKAPSYPSVAAVFYSTLPETPSSTLRNKMISMHDRWQAFRGDSTDSKDLIFTAKRSSLVQFKTTLNVFLAITQRKMFVIIRLRGVGWSRSCVIYAGDSDVIVAQMHKKHTVESVLIGKDNFAVTVYPNVDYAFIVTLIEVLNEINREEKEDN
ncbi:LURP-one-like protein [Quillaja saponaria]|uniref:LURP-one-like protein n=1 Tax=Quillaja saponaria TaxID=32244 RepID=A0AAD7L256_QUISA|nr:LURP-one-like protein [Quillaja saponaria]